MADSPLHKAPTGLIDLLRLRTQGQQPSLFGDLVAPVVDATNFYGADLQRVTNLASATAINPIGSIVTAPDGPGRLLGLSGELEMGAVPGTQFAWALAYRPQATDSPHYLAAGVVDAPVTPATYYFAAPPQNLVFPASAQFFLVLVGDATGSDHTARLRTLFEDYNLG